MKFQYPIYKEMYEAKVMPCIREPRRVWYCKACVRFYKLKKK